MFYLDMPNIPPQSVPVMIAQANQTQAGSDMKRTIGVCFIAPNINVSGENVLSPVAGVSYYLRQYEKQNVTGPAAVTILQQPKHGVLRAVTQADVGTILAKGGDPVDPSAGLHIYLPEAGYVGKDSATLLVDFGSVKLTVKYYFQAINGPVGDNWVEDYCIKTGVYWKISANLDANVNTKGLTLHSRGTR